MAASLTLAACWLVILPPGYDLPLHPGTESPLEPPLSIFYFLLWHHYRCAGRHMERKSIPAYFDVAYKNTTRILGEGVFILERATFHLTDNK